MMHLALISFCSRYYESIAPELAEEKGRLHDRLETALRPLGKIRTWRLVDSVATASEACRQLMQEQPDVVIVLPTVAVFAELFEPAVRSVGAPIILLNLEDEEDAFDLATTRMANLIRHSHGLAVQAFSNILMRQGRAFDVFMDRIGEAGFAERLRAQCAASVLPHTLRTLKLALFGHVFEAMRDIVLDRRRLVDRLGLRVQPIPFVELLEIFRAVPTSDVQMLDDQMRHRFQIAPIPQEEWARSLRLACAYKALCQKHKIAGGALNSHGVSGLDVPEIGIMSTLAISLLTEEGVSLAEVGDLQTGVALFLARQMGVPATYAELDFVDREQNRWFIANSGELDLAMIDPQRPVWIRSNVNFRGHCGGGAAFDAALRPGPATIFSFTEAVGETYRLVIAEGEILAERSEVLQLVNCTFRPRGVSAIEGYRDWCMGGPVHHAALSPGHIGRQLQKMGDSLGIHCRIVS